MYLCNWLANRNQLKIRDQMGTPGFRPPLLVHLGQKRLEQYLAGSCSVVADRFQTFPESQAVQCIEQRAAWRQVESAFGQAEIETFGPERDEV